MGSQKPRKSEDTGGEQKKEKAKPKPMPKKMDKKYNLSAEDKDIRLIVRIANKDLDGLAPIEQALTGIKGIGPNLATAMAKIFEKKYGMKATTKIGKLAEEQDIQLEEIVLGPQKFGIPKYLFNRQKDIETGNDKHIIMSDLDLQNRQDIQFMARIKCYKGVRHSQGLPVRGQRTKSTHRWKGGVIGVQKKQVAQAAGVAAAAPEKK